MWELQQYNTAYSSEAKYQARFVSLLRNFPTCFSRRLESGHVTGSAWVVSENHEEVVLLHHKKLDRWLQPGGHADGEEDILKVAQKELEEETGLQQYRWVSDKIFDIDIHLIPGRGAEKAHFHYDIRFLAVASTSAPLIVSSESRAVAWVPLSSVTRKTGFDESILRMADKTSDLGKR